MDLFTSKRSLLTALFIIVGEIQHISTQTFRNGQFLDPYAASHDDTPSSFGAHMIQREFQLLCCL